MCSSQDPSKAYILPALLTCLKLHALVHSHWLDLHEAGCLLSGHLIRGLDLPGPLAWCHSTCSSILCAFYKWEVSCKALAEKSHFSGRNASQVLCLSHHVPSGAPPASDLVPDARIQLVKACPLPCKVPLSLDGSIHSWLLPKSVTSMRIAKYSATLLAGFLL